MLFWCYFRLILLILFPLVETFMRSYGPMKTDRSEMGPGIFLQKLKNDQRYGSTESRLTCSLSQVSQKLSQSKSNSWIVIFMLHSHIYTGLCRCIEVPYLWSCSISKISYWNNSYQNPDI